jgi:hypothetical protein
VVNKTNQPILTVITPPTGIFPSQVKVKIPMAGVTDAYGVMISLGVVDQSLALAKRVLLVSGSFDSATFFHHSSVDVALKFGINGRWHRKPFKNVQAGQGVALNENFSFALALDHPPNGGPILFSSHGKIIQGAGRVMEQLEPDRTLRVGDVSTGRVYNFDPDIINNTGNIEADVTSRMSGTLNVRNDPLGVADFSQTASQLGVSKQPFQLKGRALDEDQTLAEIFFKSPTQTDYLIDGTIEGKAQ